MSLALVRLLQLASPALPVGAYSYSQGLEWAVEAGTVQDEASALRWIGDQLEWNLGRYEAPLLLRMLEAWQVGAGETVRELDAEYLATRESAELRAETLQMGYSMQRLLHELGDFPSPLLAAIAVSPTPTLMQAWTCAAAASLRAFAAAIPALAALIATPALFKLASELLALARAEFNSARFDS